MKFDSEKDFPRLAKYLKVAVPELTQVKSIASYLSKCFVEPGSLEAVLAPGQGPELMVKSVPGVWYVDRSDTIAIDTQLVRDFESGNDVVIGPRGKLHTMEAAILCALLSWKFYHRFGTWYATAGTGHRLYPAVEFMKAVYGANLFERWPNWNGLLWGEHGLGPADAPTGSVRSARVNILDAAKRFRFGILTLLQTNRASKSWSRWLWKPENEVDEYWRAPYLTGSWTFARQDSLVYIYSMAKTMVAALQSFPSNIACLGSGSRGTGQRFSGSGASSTSAIQWEVGLVT